jgi:hypothetical protein
MHATSAQTDLNFNLGEQKDLLRQEIRKLVDHECPREYVREMDEKEEFPRKVWNALREAGYLGIPIDTQYGGAGGDILDMIIVIKVCRGRNRVKTDVSRPEGHRHVSITKHPTVFVDISNVLLTDS